MSKAAALKKRTNSNKPFMTEKSDKKTAGQKEANSENKSPLKYATPVTHLARRRGEDKSPM